MPRQRSSCSRAIAALSSTRRHSAVSSPSLAARCAGSPPRRRAPWRAACSARARSPRPAGRARRAGATRPAAPRPRGARRCRARPPRPGRCRRTAGGSARRAPPPRRSRPPPDRRSQIRTWPLAQLQAGQGGADAGAARARGRVAAGAAEHLLAAPARAAQEGVVRGDHPALRVQHHDAVVDAVDDGLELLALRAHVAQQAGHRVGHRVELAAEPGDGVGAADRAPAARGRRPRSGARWSRSAGAGAAPTTRTTPAIATTSSSARPALPRGHPAQVAVHGGADLARVEVDDQDAVDPVLRVVAAGSRPRGWGPGSRCAGASPRASRSPGSRSAAPAGSGGRPGRSASSGSGRVRARAARSSSAAAPRRSSSITRSTCGCCPKLWIIRSIRLRSFSSIWCSSPARISSPWVSAVARALASRVSKWWTE